MLIFSGCSCAVFSIRQILAENTSDCVGFSVHGVFGDLPDLPTSTTDSERLGYESSKLSHGKQRVFPNATKTPSLLGDAMFSDVKFVSGRLTV